MSNQTSASPIFGHAMQYEAMGSSIQDKPNTPTNVHEEIGRLTIINQNLNEALMSSAREIADLRHRLHIAEQFALQMAEKHGPKSVY